MKDFFTLTPDRVMRAVEASGLPCTGYCATLNSYENRVYEVELDLDPQQYKTLSSRRRVIKFYRPRRWTKEQISEEHQFLQELLDNEIPVIAPERFPDGQTLHTLQPEQQDSDPIYFALWPKVGGRAPEEWVEPAMRETLPRLGRLLARIHSVGAAKPAPLRKRLDPTTYGREPLKFLLDGGFLPLELKRQYEETALALIERITPRFDALAPQAWHRVHGDCHPGNLLWNSEGPFFLDFDDFCTAPAAQDLWLLIPGRDEQAREQMRLMLEGYEQLRKFDRSQLRLIEPLRALRFIHYSAWLARRWEDPAFPIAFPEFGSFGYWQSELEDLREQLRWIDSPVTLD